MTAIVDISSFVAESWDDIKSPTTSEFTTQLSSLRKLVNGYEQVMYVP